MRVVVSVKATPGGGQSSQATRYIAYRERDEEREGKEPRPLFSAKEDGLSFWKAGRLLTEDRTPTKDELIHVAVSFRDADFQALGPTEPARQQGLKEVTRDAIAKMAEELQADGLRWVAGIHRNTDHPHIHLLLHRACFNRETGSEKRLSRLPAEMLPSRSPNPHSVEPISPGKFGLAFETALDRAQERARTAEPKRTQANERTVRVTREELANPAASIRRSAEDDLLDIARRNPSLAGRELTQEIILRSAARGPEERSAITDLRAAFRSPSMDDPDYRTQPEQADWLGQRSQELRDLYERGAQVKGDVLILPAQEYELSEDRDQPFINTLSYAHKQIRNPDAATEFHALARAIAGQTADSRTEIETFRHYFARLNPQDRDPANREIVEQTLREMRLLADEMAKLETRNSIESVSRIASLEELQETKVWRDLENDRNEVPANEERDLGAFSGTFGMFNKAARKVNLNQESLRFPAGLSVEAKERLVTQTLPTIDRQIETGRRQETINAAIEGTIYQPDQLAALPEHEQEERRRIGGFLKAYVDERLNDPETRALNRSAAFRSAHRQMINARTPEELSRTAEEFLRENLARSAALRLHHADPERHPKPEIMPLSVRERNLLFFGRAPEHHTAEMRDLRYLWGLSRKQRMVRVQALRERQLLPSPTLEKMLAELSTRRGAQAIRHYQATILNEEMRNPGKLNLRHMFEQLPPHERTFLIAATEDKKRAIEPTQSMPSQNDSLSPQASASAERPFGSPPRESPTYREYMANMAALEARLLNKAVQEKHGHWRQAGAHKEELSLSITDARSQLSNEAQSRIREQARNLAWEHLAPPPESTRQPESAAFVFTDTIAHLQQQVQPRARLAHQVLGEFTKERLDTDGRNGPQFAADPNQVSPADAQQLKALETYAARAREELYRGFEALDLLRRDLEKTREHDEFERPQSVELISQAAPSQDQRLSINDGSDGRDLQLANYPHLEAGSSPTMNDNSERFPNAPESRPWFVDSEQKWHFEHLPSPPGETSERDFAIDSSRDAISHDFGYDR